MIDSHPDDIAHIDFIKPDGTPKMATLGDERQLNDGSFNAGLDSGSSYEWTDERNRLKFYVDRQEAPTRRASCTTRSP